MFSIQILLHFSQIVLRVCTLVLFIVYMYLYMHAYVHAYIVYVNVCELVCNVHVYVHAYIAVHSFTEIYIYLCAQVTRSQEKIARLEQV